MVLFDQARRCKNTSGGFTLIELMIVIAIIGIIAVYGTPKYQGIKEQYRLEEAAQAVISELKYAKQLAVDQRRSSYVMLTSSGVSVYQKTGAQYTKLDGKSFDTRIAFKYDGARDFWMSSFTDSTGQLMGSGLSYDFRGFVSNSGTIYLETEGGSWVGVKIEQSTGYITITWP